MVEKALLVVAILAILAFLGTLWQLMVSHGLREELEELKRQLSEAEEEEPLPPTAVAEPAPAAEAKPSFASRLNQVERQQGQTKSFTAQTYTEKYRFVASLAAQGMDARGIAEALQMAPAEVEQLMQLAKLKQS